MDQLLNARKLFTQKCCNCTKNDRETTIFSHFEDSFGYHGNMVTKATEYILLFNRTTKEHQLDVLFTFLPQITKKI